MVASYEVLGKLSEINIDEILTRVKNEIDIKKQKHKKIIKNFVAMGIGIFFAAAIHEYSYAAELTLASSKTMLTASTTGYGTPTKLIPILKFIKWLIWLLKWIFSSVIGLIATVAGFKWGTDISGGGQTEAKKILKNCFIGGLIVWTGAGIGDFFVNSLIKFLEDF